MKKGLMVMALVLAVGLSTTAAFAEKGCGHDKGGSRKKSTKDMFFKKVHMIYIYQDEIGVSDKQLEKIKELKIGLKKDIIKKKADIEVIAVDIKALLYEDDVNVGAINKLIDKKYEAKKAKSKMLVDAYAKLKKILKKEQLDILKDIYMEKKKSCNK